MCCEADKLVPSMTYGLPLTPAADSCRTSRHALTLIATARPAAFITTMAREVARYNTMQQNAQALNVNPASSVLARAKPEILRIVEQLIDKMQSEMNDLLVDVIIFSLQNFLKLLRIVFSNSILFLGHGHYFTLLGSGSSKN